MGANSGDSHRNQAGSDHGELAVTVASPASIDPSRNRAASESIPPQHRHVTVLFTDLKGYTRMIDSDASDARGKEILLGLKGELFIESDAIVRDHEGEKVQFGGDGIMALFGVRHSDDSSNLRACRAALALQRLMDELGEKFAEHLTTPPKMRIGLASGSAFVGEIGPPDHRELTAEGRVVVLARRIEEFARPGTILVDETFYRSVEGGVKVKELSFRVLKGIKKPERLFRLDGIVEDASRFERRRRRGLSRLVERSDALNAVSNELKTVEDGGRWEDGARVIAVTGDAGIGKSRLIHEVKKSESLSDVLVLQGNCAPDRKNRTFSPFVEISRRALSVQANDSDKRMEDKVKRTLEWLGLDVRPAPYIVNLLSRGVPQALVELDAEVLGA